MDSTITHDLDETGQAWCGRETAVKATTDHFFPVQLREHDHWCDRAEFFMCFGKSTCGVLKVIMGREIRAFEKPGPSSWIRIAVCWNIQISLRSSRYVVPKSSCDQPNCPSLPTGATPQPLAPTVVLGSCPRRGHVPPWPHDLRPVPSHPNGHGAQIPSTTR